jgi:hypothetical protein
LPVLLLRLLRDEAITLLVSSATGSPDLFASSRLSVAAVLGGAPRFVFRVHFPAALACISVGFQVVLSSSRKLALFLSRRI